MKACSKLLLVPFGLSGVMLLSGCITSQQVSFNEVRLSGPIVQTPLHVTIDPEPGQVEISPRFSLNTNEAIHSTLEPVQTFGVPPTLQRHPWGGSQNMEWVLPRNGYGLDFQVIAADHFAVLAGGTLSALDGNQFTNLYAGLAYFSVKENLGVRLDGGVQFTTLRYHSRSTVTTEVDYFFGHDTYYSNFDDTGTEQGAGAYLGLTLNSAKRDVPVNFFVHAGFAWQPLLKYRPSYPDSIAGPGDGTTSVRTIGTTATILSAAAGIALDLGGGSRVLLGGKGLFPLNLTNGDPSAIWQPFLQMVFTP